MIILKFEAPWCGQCKAIDKSLGELSRFGIEAEIKHINVDTNEGEDLLSKYNVKSIPTLIVLKGTEEVCRIHGVQTTKYIIDKLNKLN